MTKSVDGKDKSLRELLSDTQFSIDYYQREYKWETKHVEELIDDLTSKFLAAYRPHHVRSEIANYPAYFLGSIILSRKDSEIFIVDGQQRLTTITLLLMYLRNLQAESGQPIDPNVEPLIVSTQYGQRNFNIKVDERQQVIEALFNRTPVPAIDEDTSVANICERYSDIDARFPPECREAVLPFFMDWLIERVQLVEISAYSDDDAYTIFETMNDRGLSLSPADMLKGFLLSNIRDSNQRSLANEKWKDSIPGLAKFGREAENDFFRSWFRGQYALTVGQSWDDYERLGPEFHRWLRENPQKAGLGRSEDYGDFATSKLPHFAAWYVRVRAAGQNPDSELSAVYYNSTTEASLDQSLLLLSALAVGDSPGDSTAKIALVSRYLDIFVGRRAWASKNLTKQALKGTLLPFARTLRGKSLDDLASALLADLLKPGHDDFETSPPTLGNGTKRRVHTILARLTDFVERGAGTGGDSVTYQSLIVKQGKNRIDIEHILPIHFERAEEDFDSEQEFTDWRNKLGALVLLPHTFNASYRDMEWEKKLPLYSRPGHNLLAASLAGATYGNNPRLRDWAIENHLQFKHYDISGVRFGKKEIDERTNLYRKMAQLIWNPLQILDPTLVDVDKVRARTEELLGDGVLFPPPELKILG